MQAFFKSCSLTTYSTIEAKIIIPLSKWAYNFVNTQHVDFISLAHFRFSSTIIYKMRSDLHAYDAQEI